jgi:flavin reductase (DIM6/NTAB) family NADH-FMN oxidoreductase RutF
MTTGFLPADSESIDPALFKEVLGHFATGVAVIAAIEASEPVGFTCQSFISLSLDPPLIGFAASRDSSSWPRIARAGRFCVNVLSSEQHELCRVFATSGIDKFASTPWRLSPLGSPMIDGAVAVVECDLQDVHVTGDHDLAIGRVRDIGRCETRPLLYFRSGFGHFAPLSPVGDSRA